MISVPLQIRYADTPQRPVVAWFVPGNGPRAWFDPGPPSHAAAKGTSARCPMSIDGGSIDGVVSSLRESGSVAGAIGLNCGADVTLRIVPRSVNDLLPVGALVTARAGQELVVMRRGLPYGRLAGRLYLPVEAVLTPAVSEAELDELLGSTERTWIWHPTAGLVAFDAGDELRVADLLATPDCRDGDWGRAVAGVGLPRRLLSVEADVMPTSDAVLDEGRDDIGSQAPSRDALPPAADEPRPGAVCEMSRSAARSLAGMVGWMAEKLAKRGVAESRTSWLSKVGDWASGKIAALQAADLAARHREIHRLLRLLESNPDEGLRYALPVGADAAHRGIAPPSNKLGRRNVNFNLRSLGGGAADFWHIDPQYQTWLNARYRELAARELRLGRHRRAAYIYAQLLGDLESAAAALKAGGHFREAAVLYRDRLDRPQAAAQCLVQAGLLTDAIALYEELGEYETVGDLYARLDRPDEARDCYRRAALDRLEAEDFLAAARLYETKLDDPDAALDCLDAGWRGARQPGTCLDETFRLLGRLGRHEAARQRVGSFVGSHVPRERAVLVVNCLANVATEYPDLQLQSAAADVTRVTAGTQLPGASLDDRRRLVAAVGRLVPQDRLLQRDCQRFVHLASGDTAVARTVTFQPVQQSESRRAASPPPRRTTRLVHDICLPQGIEWRCAQAAGAAFYAAGYRCDDVNRLVLVRGFWEQPKVQATVEWQVRSAGGEARILLAPDPHDRNPVIVHVLGQPPLQRRVFAKADFAEQQAAVGTPTWLEGRVLALARAPHGVTWSVTPGEDEASFVLSAAQSWSEPIASRLVPLPEPVEWPGPSATNARFDLPLHARADRVFFAIANQLVRYIPDKETVHTTSLTAPICGLAGSPPHTRVRVAATFDWGAAVYFDDGPLHEVQPLCEDLERPAAGYTGDGRLVVAAAGHCEIYRTDGGGLSRVAEIPSVGFAPFAVLAADRANRIGLCTSEGTIRVCEILRPAG